MGTILLVPWNKTVRGISISCIFWKAHRLLTMQLLQGSEVFILHRVPSGFLQKCLILFLNWVKYRAKLYLLMGQKSNPAQISIHLSGKSLLQSIRPACLRRSYLSHICGKRNSYSKTDPDATFMRMKEDAMLNGQLKPAYNLQLGVDSGYISWLMLSPRPTDTNTLIPFLTGMEATLRHKYPVVVADAGYESEENYSFLEDHRITAMIKPANYEISRTKKYKADISRKENMPYDPDGDFYTCRNGCRLYACGINERKSFSGYIRRETIYRCRDWVGCQYKAECIKGRNWKIPEEERFKRLSVSRTFERQRKECLERITSEEGIKLRVNRSIQAEGAFALWKEDGSFRQFLCRGQANVYAESVLMAIAQNIDNLHRRIQNGKLGMHLYEV